MTEEARKAHETVSAALDTGIIDVEDAKRYLLAGTEEKLFSPTKGHTLDAMASLSGMVRGEAELDKEFRQRVLGVFPESKGDRSPSDFEPEFMKELQTI